MSSNQFKPTFIYIKEHSITGMLYFGKTTKNPEKYLGSGKYWKRHIKKYGKQYVVNLWYTLFLSYEECIQFATNFSKQYNIIESVDWANLISENGLDGAPCGHIGHIFTESELEKLSKASYDRWQDPVYKEKLKESFVLSWTDDRKQKQRERLIGIKRPEHSKALSGRILTEEQREKLRKPKHPGHGAKVSAANKGKPKSESHRANLSAAMKGKTRATRKYKPVIDNKGLIWDNPNRWGKHYKVSPGFFNDLDKTIKSPDVYLKLDIEMSIENMSKTKRELGFSFHVKESDY